MKRSVLILLFFGVVISSQAQSRDQARNGKLIHAIIGRWKVIKFESERETFAKPKMLEFLSDGTFKSDSIFFSTNEGSFRTDENSGLLILENGRQMTEWKATLRRGVLQLELLPKFNQTRINMTMIRITEG